jgi:hypothetical protein
MQRWSQNFRRLKWIKYSKSPLGKRFLSNCVPHSSQKRNGVGFLWAGIGFSKAFILAWTCIKCNSLMTAAVRVASGMAHCSLRAGDLADAKSVPAGRLAVKCDVVLLLCAGVGRQSSNNPAVVVYEAHLVAAVLNECHRHQRRPSPRPVLAGVEALAAQGMRDKERFTLEVHPTAGAGACVAGRGNVYGASGVVAAEGLRHELAGCRFIGSNPPSATWRSARKSADGNSLPRFSARRRMPRQAVDERK